jgi:hypothetical protein
MSGISMISDTSIVPLRGEPDENLRYDRWGSALAFALAAACLSFALVLPAPLSTIAVGSAVVFCGTGLLLPPLKPLERYGDGPVAFALAVALVLHVGSLLTGITTPATTFPLAAGLLLAGANLSPVSWLGRAQVPLLLLVYVAFAALAVAESTTFSTPLGAGVDALLTRENPYAHGYREMPVLLLLAVPGRLLGDLRYGLVAATALSAACIAGARPGRAGAISAGMLLFLPAQLVAVKDAGIEPFITLLLALTVLCACRFPAVFPFVLGLLLTAKTYLVLAVPLAVVLASLKLSFRAVLSVAWKAVFAAALVTGPFIAWDPEAFFRALTSTGGALGLKVPTLWGWLSLHGVQLPGWLALPLALVAVTLVLWRAARTPSGFAAGVALVFVVFFAFNPEAVASQYAFVLAALYISVGATGLPGVMIEAGETRSFYVMR